MKKICLSYFLKTTINQLDDDSTRMEKAQKTISLEKLFTFFKRLKPVAKEEKEMNNCENCVGQSVNDEYYSLLRNGCEF